MSQQPIDSNLMSEPIHVPKIVDEEKVKFFVENGYIVAEGLISQNEVEELRQDTLFMARGGYPSQSLKPLPETMNDKEVLENILCIHQPHHLSPVLKKYVTHEKVCGVLSQIAAAHLPFWDGSVKVCNPCCS